MARPYTIPVIEDIPLASTVQNLLEGRSGRVLDEPSRVRLYATRETVDVTVGMTLGREEVVPAGSVAALNATAGTLPSRQDDLLAETLGNGGDEIIVQGVNADGAAARELRLIVDVISIEDLAALPGSLGQ